jgi:predicted metallopeptidase
MIEEEEIPKSYEVSTEVAAYAKAVIETWPDEFEHLGEANIAYLLTTQPITIKGSHKTACAMIPNCKGQEGNIFYWALTTILGFTPDAFVIVDKDSWESMKDGKEVRVILIHHELLHLPQKESTKGPCFNTDTNRPVLKMRDHEVESFFVEAERFGAWNGRILEFVDLVMQKEGKFRELDKVVELAESYEVSNGS